MRSTPWIRFAAVIAARGVLASIIGMLFWAVAPMLLGWHSTTVMTGSMEPSLHVGDVVVSKPVDPHQLRKGQVLLFHDPDHTGVLRMHRFDTLNTDGTLTTKGDANPTADSTPITRSAVLGVGYLRVPLIGIPVIWASQHNISALAVLGGALLGTSALAIIPPTPDQDSVTTTRRRARHRAHRRPLGTPAAAIITITVCATALALPAPAAAAGFAATATTASTFNAATALPVTAYTCTSNPDGSVTIGWRYTGTEPDHFTVIVDGQDVTTQPASSRTATLNPWNLFAWRSSTVRIRTNLTNTWTATTDDSVRITTIRFLGIGRTSCLQ